MCNGASQRLATLGLFLGSSLLLGSTCSPSPPGCPYDECEEVGDLVQTRSCINFCAPIYPGPILDDSVHCALDECDADTVAGHWRCPPGNSAGQAYTCVRSDTTPDPDRIGVCRASAGVLDPCDPDDPAACESNTYCWSMADPEARAYAERLGVVVNEDQGFCWLPQREGYPCDSDLGRGDLGYQPCEWGTWCLSVGGAERRCMRSCTDLGPWLGWYTREGRRPDLCGCTDEDPEEQCAGRDEHGVTPLDDPPDGVWWPWYVCELPKVPNGARCSANGLACADPDALCVGPDPERPDPNPVVGTGQVCCRADGLSCEELSDCCRGSTCLDGKCENCGLDGEATPNGGCCEGHVSIENVCRSCSVSREGRDLSLRDGASCQGHFVQFDGAGGVETFAVPRGGNTGGGHSELPLTSEIGADTVRYHLKDNHRLFLLQGDLTGDWNRRPAMGQHPPTYLSSSAGPWPEAGITVGHSFAQLPPNFPGAGVRSLPLTEIPGGMPNSTWQSFRVYDSGTCSTLQPFWKVTDAVVASVNRFLVDPQFPPYGSTPLTLLGTHAGNPYDQRAHIAPILASGRGDIGRSSEQDQLGLFLGYRAVGGEAFGCPNGTLWFSAGFRIARDAAVVPTIQSEDLDRIMTAPHDFIDYDLEFCPDGECYGWCLYPGECPETCTIDGDRYICEFYVEPVETMFARYVERPVRRLRDSFDFRPVLMYLDGGLQDCGWTPINDLLTHIMSGYIRELLPGVFREFTSASKVELPNPALGISFGDLRDCGRSLPGGGLVPSDALCADDPSPPFGNRRLRCVGFDANGQRAAPATQYRCADVYPEVRRVNVRPDGLEAVYADSPADPQHPLIAYWASGWCSDEHGGAMEPTDVPITGVIERAVSLLSNASPITRRICHPDDPLTPSGNGFKGCDGMCADRGAPCLGVPGVPGRDGRAPDGGNWNDGANRDCYLRRTGTGSREVSAFCCDRDSFCPIPEAAGGARYFSDPVAPGDPPAFWACVNRNNNPFACGACGVSCATGEACCGGSCLDVMSDPMNCGGCGVVCPTGECASGACCGPGELVCGGACTDVRSHGGNCGACGNACAGGETCSNGLCCPLGQVSCWGTCRAIASDPSHCGACGVSCVGAEECTNGTCCASPERDCNGDGTCENLMYDPRNCGGCGRDCGAGACIGGHCF